MFHTCPPCFSVGFALIVCKLRVELNFSSDVEMRDIPKKHDQNPWTQYHIFSKCNYISFLFFTQVFAIWGLDSISDCVEAKPQQTDSKENTPMI